MPKVKIEAKLVLDDIRAGLDEAALMEKYNLSIKGLHSVLQKLVTLRVLDESYNWTGKSTREMHSSQGNRELSAKEVVRDIKAGMTDGQLMRKYKLSSKGLQHLLEQLIEAGLIKDDDLEIGKPQMESTVELTADVLAADTANTPEAGDVTEPISEDIKPSPAVAAASAPVQPLAATAPPATKQPEPVPQEPKKVAKASAAVAAKQRPQEVRITDTSEPDFPNTLPLTVVAPVEPETSTPPLTVVTEKVAKPSPALVSKKELEPPQKQVQAPPPAAGSTDKQVNQVKTVPDRTTIHTEEKSKESAALAAPALSDQASASEPPRSQDPSETLELVWKCPACGQKQHQVHDECPICGIVAAKFLEQQKKGLEPEIRIPEKKLEPITPPVPVIETPVPPVTAATVHQKPPTPVPETTIKPPKPEVKPEVVPEETREEEIAASSGLGLVLTGLAITQLVLVIVYAAVQLVLYRDQYSSVSALGWYCGGLILMSVVVGALLHASAVLVTLHGEILAETKKNGAVLRTILDKLSKRTD
jgi:hypothetical protein